MKFVKVSRRRELFALQRAFWIVQTEALTLKQKLYILTKEKADIPRIWKSFVWKSVIQNLYAGSLTG